MIKKTCWIVYFAVSEFHSESETQRKRKERQVLGSCQRTKKVMEQESDDNTSYNWCSRNDCQRLGKKTWIVGNQRTSRDRPNYSITKISQNTEKSPRNLSLAVTQTPVKDYQLTLLWKLPGINIVKIIIVCKYHSFK